MVSRARFYVDVAWMLRMRERHLEFLASDGALFTMSDATLQSGKNLMMSEYTAIKGESLAAVNDAIFRSKRAHTSEWGGGLEIHMRECQATIKGALYQHKYPPVALGFRHAKGSHKMHALTHQKRLESYDFEGVIGLVAAEFSQCTDRGEMDAVEAKFNPADLFPYWTPMHIEGDAADVLAGGAASLEVDTTRILDVMGSYHAIDNMQKRITSALPENHEQIARMEVTAQTFHQIFLRCLSNCVWARLNNTCTFSLIKMGHPSSRAAVLGTSRWQSPRGFWIE